MRLKIRENLRISLPEHKIYWLLHIGAARIFDWEGVAKPQITCNGVIRNYRKRYFLRGKDVEWKIRSRTLNQDFAKNRGLKPMVKKRNGRNWRCVAERLSVIKKKAILMPFDHISNVFRAI